MAQRKHTLSVGHKMKSFLLFVSIFLTASFALAAGSTSVSYSVVQYGLSADKRVRKVTVSFTADASDGSVPDTSLALNGFLIKAVTNPGSTAPTDNWDIALEDPDDSALDAAATLLNNRDTATTEQVYPLISGAATPIFLAGTYGLAISGNSVNSATGVVILYLVDSL